MFVWIIVVNSFNFCSQSMLYCFYKKSMLIFSIWLKNLSVTCFPYSSLIRYTIIFTLKGKFYTVLSYICITLPFITFLYYVILSDKVQNAEFSCLRLPGLCQVKYKCIFLIAMLSHYYLHQQSSGFHSPHRSPNEFCCFL